MSKISNNKESENNSEYNGKVEGVVLHIKNKFKDLVSSTKSMYETLLSQEQFQ